MKTSNLKQLRAEACPTVTYRTPRRPPLSTSRPLPCRSLPQCDFIQVLLKPACSLVLGGPAEPRHAPARAHHLAEVCLALGEGGDHDSEGLPAPAMGGSGRRAVHERSRGERGQRGRGRSLLEIGKKAWNKHEEREPPRRPYLHLGGRFRPLAGTTNLLEGVGDVEYAGVGCDDDGLVFKCKSLHRAGVIGRRLRETVCKQDDGEVALLSCAPLRPGLRRCMSRAKD